MITIENLSVYYKDFKALEIKDTLTINPNDRIGVIGANGAGKTTLIKACLGMIDYQGSITSVLNPEEMAVHMQSNEYVESISCKTLLETILNTSYSQNTKLQDIVHTFEFEPSLKKRFKELSGGQKQRLTLILVLMQDSKITFFDEVTTGLDFETRQLLMRLINDWYKGKDASILFVTHYYEELEQLTNKLMILDKGHLVDMGYRDDLFKKYCGHSIITFRDHHDLSWDVKQLLAPDNMTALSCANKEDERYVINRLIDLGISFKRSDNDVEILTMNAIGGQVQ
ncbi:ABC transporter ATP-binding protein [Erysipelothrix larvae]|uniref:ABC transporter ATP-binding protein n=1 Tax=Erysipelothrix larvae TaxID=1514105 RepID=A0A0X8GY43_9FIRM|nr:ABC transporter ATP-binding protein [Erysipelothrix larvae]AMC92562.1 ABC transporter ATP-binding protein [Erysipelothrix larvae]